MLSGPRTARNVATCLSEDCYDVRGASTWLFIDSGSDLRWSVGKQWIDSARSKMDRGGKKREEGREKLSRSALSRPGRSLTNRTNTSKHGQMFRAHHLRHLTISTHLKPILPPNPSLYRRLILTWAARDSHTQICHLIGFTGCSRTPIRVICETGSVVESGESGESRHGGHGGHSR